MRLQFFLSSSTIQLSVLLGWPHLAEKTKNRQSDNAVSPVGSRVRACMGIVELFKHLRCTTTNLELQRDVQDCQQRLNSALDYIPVLRVSLDMCCSFSLCS